MEKLNENDTTFIERFLYAFKILGGSKDGNIDYDLFKRQLSKCYSLEAKEILHIIEEGRHVQEGNLNFISLCSSIVSTKAAFNRIPTENGKISSVTNPRVNSGTFTRKKAAAALLPSNSSDGKNLISATKSIRGMVFHNSDGCSSHRYLLDLSDKSDLEITIKAMPAKGDGARSAQVELFIFHDNKNHSYVYSSVFKNDEGHLTTSCCLKKGRYILVPVLLDWTANHSYSNDSLNIGELVSFSEEMSFHLTPVCRDALGSIFQSIDLDGDGLVSREEFEIFLQHVSGERAKEEEWSAIEDNFPMQDGQLTCQGFLEMYHMVMKTDPADVTAMFQKMGLNETLELENALPFHLTVKSSTAAFTLKPQPITSTAELAERVLRKTTVEQGMCRKIKNMNDLFVFCHKLPHRTTILVQNQSHSKVTVQLDCSKSTNCKSHRQNLVCCVEVQQKTSVFGHHLFPVDPSKSWDVQCSESLI